jgi:4-amino-4-deoxy-L-arabinose transferase-like glycosyltransferase
VTHDVIGDRTTDQRGWSITGFDDRRGRLIALAPLALVAALCLPGIGQRLIYLGDEARYALLARDMVQSGDWLVPRIGSEVHMEKTPLFIWAIAALSLAGRRVTELTAVLPAALSAIAGVAMTMLLGRRMFGPRAAVLSGLALATAWGYVWHGRVALADMMVTCFVVAGAAAFWTAVGREPAARGPMALFWTCLGLALAAKGPVGLMPLLPCAAFLVAERGWAGLRALRPLTGVGVLLLVSLPWALGFALQRETSYVQSVLVEDFLAPRLRGWRHASELFFAVGPIVVGLMPWTPFVPWAVRRGWWRAESDDTRRAFRFLVFWVLAYAVVITAVPHKRDRYLLPTFPALALMVGWLWDRWIARPSPRALRVHGWVWAGLATVMAVGVLLPLRVRPELAVLVPPTPGGRLLLSGLLVTAALLTLAAALRARPLAAFLAICLSMAVVFAYEARVFVAGHNRAYDVRALAQRLAQRAEPDADILTYRYQPLALQFYSGRTVTRARDAAELRRMMAARRVVYVVTEDRLWPEVSEPGGRSWAIVDRAQVDGRAISVGVPAR